MNRKWNKLGIAIMVMFFAGCNEVSVNPEHSGTSDQKNSSIESASAGKNELKYGLSTSPWKYVGNSVDVSAATEYFYRTDGDYLYRSVDAATWVKMSTPRGASRVSANTGYDGKDYVAVTVKGFVYLYHEDQYGTGTWTSFSNATTDNKVVTYINDLAVRKDGAVWAIGNTDNQIFWLGNGASWPSSSSKWTNWSTQKAVAMSFAPVQTNAGWMPSPLIINEHREVWLWNLQTSSWIYENANSVADICGIGWTGWLGGSGNTWITSTSGALNYWSASEPPYHYWTAWGATSVKRVGCSESNKLIVVNTDGSTYVKI